MRPASPAPVSEKAAVAAAFVLCLLSCNYAVLGHYVDDIVWVLLSRNFTEGSLMARWSYFPRVETNATWGFSLLLTPITAFFYKNALALKAWSAVLLFTGTVLFYFSLRERMSPAARRIFLLGLFFNNFYLAFSGNVTSEAGYMLIFGVALFLAPRRVLFSGLLTACLILTRVIGTSFLIAAGIEMALSKKFKNTFAYAGLVLLGVLPYFLLSKFSSGTYTYHAAGWEMLGPGGPASAARVVLENAYYYLKGLALLTFIYFPAFLPDILALKLLAILAVAALACRGAFRQLPAPPGRFLVIYFLIYGLVLAVWPSQSARYALPVYPIFLFWILAGIESWVAPKRAALVWAAMGLLMLGSNLKEIKGILKTSLTSPADMPHQSYLWLREHSAPTDLIVSMDIARICYYADRTGIHFVPSDSLESFVDSSRRMGVRYFFLKQAEYVGTADNVSDPVAVQYRRLSDYLGRREFFKPVYENSDEQVKVYELASPWPVGQGPLAKEKTLRANGPANKSPK